MRLEKFSKSDYKRKRIIVISSILVFLAIFCFVIYKSYAFYEEEANYNVLKGQVGDFGYDIKMLSVVVDNEKSKTIPERGLYKTNVECSNGTTGEWDYNAWNLTLENVSESAKCSITFTSNLTQAEYNTYIDAGVALRRNTYRGKDISKYLTETGELNLYTQISSGRFNDIFVGDYIIANNITWLVADIDNYLYTGTPALTKHHLTMIPSKPFQSVKMNEIATTEGGYLGSKMVTETLSSVLSTYIEPAFSGHIITYRNLLSNAVDETVASSAYGGSLGASSGWTWVDRQLDLMSEMNVYGTFISSSSKYDVGIDNRQYAIFQLKPELINSYNDSRFSYWLKNVVSSGRFMIAYNPGYPHNNQADDVAGVRPRFLIG